MYAPWLVNSSLHLWRGWALIALPLSGSGYCIFLFMLLHLWKYQKTPQRILYVSNILFSAPTMYPQPHLLIIMRIQYSHQYYNFFLALLIFRSYSKPLKPQVQTCVLWRYCCSTGNRTPNKQRSVCRAAEHNFCKWTTKSDKEANLNSILRFPNHAFYTYRT